MGSQQPCTSYRPSDWVNQCCMCDLQFWLGKPTLHMSPSVLTWAWAPQTKARFSEASKWGSKSSGTGRSWLVVTKLTSVTTEGERGPGSAEDWLHLLSRVWSRLNHSLFPVLSCMPEGTGFKTVAGGLQGLILMGAQQTFIPGCTGRVGVYVTRNPLPGNSGSRRLCVEPTYRPRLASYNDLVTLIFKNQLILSNYKSWKI